MPVITKKVKKPTVKNADGSNLSGYYPRGAHGHATGAFITNQEVLDRIGQDFTLVYSLAVRAQGLAGGKVCLA